MKSVLDYVLTASLGLVAATGCRGEPGTMNPVDLGSTADLTTAPVDLPMPVDLTSGPADFAGVDLAAPPPPTEFMVVRIGDGTAVAAGVSAPVFVERRKVADGSMVGAAIAMPTTVSGTNKRLTLTTSSVSEGGLSLSSDGRYLVLAGYDAAPGTAAVGTSMSATVNRVIGRIDAAGAVDTTTAADFFNAVGIRSAGSTDGKDLWAAGSAGIVYTTLGATTAPTSVSSANMRWLAFISSNGQLYASSSSGANRGINTVGSGAPRTAAAVTLLPGFSAQNTTSHYGYVAFDRALPPGIDVIYVADDRAVATGGGVQRWSLQGTTWTLDGTLAKGLTVGGARGVTGFLSGSSVTLLVTTDETPPRIVSFVDDGTALSQITATQLVAGTANVVYRGIALPPK